MGLVSSSCAACALCSTRFWRSQLFRINGESQIVTFLSCKPRNACSLQNCIEFWGRRPNLGYQCFLARCGVYRLPPRRLPRRNVVTWIARAARRRRKNPQVVLGGTPPSLLHFYFFFLVHYLYWAPPFLPPLSYEEFQHDSTDKSKHPDLSRATPQPSWFRFTANVVESRFN